MKKKVLSVVITAHKEGLFLNKTLLSISNGLNKIKDVYEIIINLDNSDKETNRIAKIWEDKDEKEPIFALLMVTFYCQEIGSKKV